MDLNEKLMGMEQATDIPVFPDFAPAQEEKSITFTYEGTTVRLLTLHICRYRCIHRKVLIICRRNMRLEITWREQDSV